MNSHLTPESGVLKPNSAVGFTLIFNGDNETIAHSLELTNRVLSHFDDTDHLSLQVGKTFLTVWGRGKLENCFYQLPDESYLVLIGSPVGDFSWIKIESSFSLIADEDLFSLPWEGRVILLRISSNGNVWKLWNDWVGSIPVFHAKTNFGRIASTLEPVIVKIADTTSDRVYLPGLISLLLWGHYFHDWTLYPNIKVVPPDCFATWEDSKFIFNQYFSITPSDEGCDLGLDNLIDEMYSLTHQAISNALKQHDRWLIPLSSGLDSRLIAAVASELNTDIYTYTWGTSKSSDVIQAKKIARSLDIPWKHIDSGNNYLTKYRQNWIDLFGTSMHFHGMYQMPFLDALINEPSGPIMSGFMGDALSGYATQMVYDIHFHKYPYQIVPDGYLHWTIEELRDLITNPIEAELNTIASEVENFLENFPGALYQKLNFLTIWGRQRYFTYFQSMMSDYWRGTSTPFIDRAYACFTSSLPRSLLDNRTLQKFMLARYYPKLASLPGSYAKEPALLSGSYLLKKRLAKYIPEMISKKVFPDLYRTKSNSDLKCILNDGKKSFFPLFENIDLVNGWLNIEIIQKTYDQILETNSIHAIRKLQSIQTFALHQKSN